MQLFPNNPDRWERVWQYASERSPLRKRNCRSNEERIKKWNLMAKWFASQTDGRDAEERREKIIERLKREGVLKPGMKVLDIGAGPGNWAISLSQISEHLTAIEPSSEMVNILEERMKKESVTNIRVIQERWEDIDLEKYGLKHQYDLVIASMTPGVNNRETLEKLMAASCGYCYMSGFSGQGRLKAYEELWQFIFKESIGENPGDIIYPFNLLYAIGYRPSLEFSSWEQNSDLQIDEAVEDIMAFLWDYVDDTPKIRKKVERYVNELAVSGIFRKKKEFCQGHILWKVV